MIKKLMSSYGDFVAGMAVVAAIVPLFQWFMRSGPLYDFIVKFAG